MNDNGQNNYVCEVWLEADGWHVVAYRQDGNGNYIDEAFLEVHVDLLTAMALIGRYITQDRWGA